MASARDLPGLVRSLCLILALSAGGACHAQHKACSPRDAAAADAAVDGLDSWTKVERMYRKYGHCDEGTIAEGNSEAVARLLVDRWSMLPRLSWLVRRDPAFMRFVLRHIDTTLDTDDLERIEALATTQCPSDSAAVCRELSETAARAAR